MSAKRKMTLVLALSASAIIGFSSCATAKRMPGKSDGAGQAVVPQAVAADQKAVAWDPEVWADFQKDVPRFVRALAKEKMEEMARDKGSYFVDRDLYSEAMAQYKR
jgi:hypothetical protein